jgi:hypothetical protein
VRPVLQIGWVPAGCLTEHSQPRRLYRTCMDHLPSPPLLHARIVAASAATTLDELAGENRQVGRNRTAEWSEQAVTYQIAPAS